jgi:hypothetical protein
MNEGLVQYGQCRGWKKGVGKRVGCEHGREEMHAPHIADPIKALHGTTRDSARAASQSRHTDAREHMIDQNNKHYKLQLKEGTKEAKFH